MLLTVTLVVAASRSPRGPNNIMGAAEISAFCALRAFAPIHTSRERSSLRARTAGRILTGGVPSFLYLHWIRFRRFTSNPAPRR